MTDCLFLETHNGECGGFGGHFYDQEKGPQISLSTRKKNKENKKKQTNLTSPPPRGGA